MVYITQIAVVGDTDFDSVKCPQCGTKLCGKPIGAKVHNLRPSRRFHEKMVSLPHTCRRCGSHYLISTDGE